MGHQPRTPTGTITRQRISQCEQFNDTNYPPSKGRSSAAPTQCYPRLNHGQPPPPMSAQQQAVGAPSPAKQGGSNAPTMHPIGPQQTKNGRAPVRRTDGRLQITRRAPNPMRAASPPPSDPPKGALGNPYAFAPKRELAPLTGNQACPDPTRENAKNQASALWPGRWGRAASRGQH